MLIAVLTAGCTGFAAAVALVAAVRHWARHRRVLDHPNERSLHQQPTPRGGGVGIVLPVTAAMALVAAIHPELRTAAMSIGVASLCVAAVGFADDIKGLGAATRLFAHVGAAVFLVIGLDAWRSVPVASLAHVDVGLAAVPLTVLWLVGLTNAYNFMDGIDGIAGSQGLVAGAGWAVVGLASGDPLVAVAGTVTSLACAGFLLFNWSPASIFMGDVGSGFLGFFLASLSVYTAGRAPAAATAGLLFVWPFVFDAAFTFVRRVRRRENVLVAHRSHLYQRLVLTGTPHQTVTLCYAALAVVGLAAGIAVALAARPAADIGLLLIAALALSLWVLVRSREKRVDPSCPQ
jgi:UDP-N-acetylmuramyl pentapeptide phosphotransferase/UDP-N-acetylglucosamine-1-phosphate transferase